MPQILHKATIPPTSKFHFLTYYFLQTMRIVITYLICSIKELDLVLRVCFTLFKVNYNVQLIPVSYSLYWYSREHLQNILKSCTAICKCNWCEFYSPRPQLLKNRQCNAWSVIFLWYPKTSDAGHNIIVDGWAGTSNPQPTKHPTQLPIPIHTHTQKQALIYSVPACPMHCFAVRHAVFCEGVPGWHSLMLAEF